MDGITAIAEFGGAFYGIFFFVSFNDPHDYLACSGYVASFIFLSRVACFVPLSSGYMVYYFLSRVACLVTPIVTTYGAGGLWSCV